MGKDFLLILFLQALQELAWKDKMMYFCGGI